MQGPPAEAAQAPDVGREMALPTSINGIETIRNGEKRDLIILNRAIPIPGPFFEA